MMLPQRTFQPQHASNSRKWMQAPDLIGSSASDGQPTAGMGMSLNVITTSPFPPSHHPSKHVKMDRVARENDDEQRRGSRDEVPEQELHKEPS